MRQKKVLLRLSVIERSVFAAGGVVDTGGNTGVVDTDCKFATGFVDASGNFATGINNTSGTVDKICRRCR